MQDIEYLKSMYPSGIRILQGYVAEACDRLDYKNSPMYDEFPDHMMINRLCDTICDTVIASEGAEKVSSMWNISEHDKAVMEMTELKKDMKRLDADFFTEDDEAEMEKEQELENVPAEDISEAEVLKTEEPQEQQAVSKVRDDFQGYRESVVNPSGIIMETQEMREREPGFPGNARMGGRPNMGQGSGRAPMGYNSGRPPMGPGPERPPMGPGPVRPPEGPNQNRPPAGGPGPVRPPQPPRPTPPPPRPPQPPRPTPPRPLPPPPRPPQPPRPIPPRPVPPPRPGKRPSWLRDMVKVLLLNEMFHRRCARGLCAL